MQICIFLDFYGLTLLSVFGFLAADPFLVTSESSERFERGLVWLLGFFGLSVLVLCFESIFFISCSAKVVAKAEVEPCALS